MGLSVVTHTTSPVVGVTCVVKMTSVIMECADVCMREGGDRREERKKRRRRRRRGKSS